jgi:hypothetical protein|nr:MAG TPA: hypothetical protein [Bacteriophage sp.]
MGLLFKSSVTAILLGLGLIAMGVMLDYFDITGIVVILGCCVSTIDLVLLAICFVIFLWREF